MIYSEPKIQYCFVRVGEVCKIPFYARPLFTHPRGSPDVQNRFSFGKSFTLVFYFSILPIRVVYCINLRFSHRTLSSLCLYIRLPGSTKHTRLSLNCRKLNLVYERLGSYDLFFNLVCNGPLQVTKQNNITQCLCVSRCCVVSK